MEINIVPKFIDDAASPVAQPVGSTRLTPLRSFNNKTQPK